MVATASVENLVGWLRRYQRVITQQRGYLTELDSAIGDADHGVNMSRGMDAVIAKIDAAPASNAEELFKSVGMTLVTSVGGASGPLYGTFFLRMGPAAGPVQSLDAAVLAAALRAGLDGVVARGKAEAGDKTMFDALAPGLDALDSSIASGVPLPAALAAASDAAEAGRDATLDLVARKGRASYLGERSAGHLDPGAASSAMLLRTLSDEIAESEG
jgi:dihydroxyacetone kinase-like protein